MQKSRKWTFIAALTAGFLFGNAHMGHAQEAVSLRLDFRLSGPHIPYYWALEKGYYKEEGLDVTIKEGAGSQQTINLIAAKEDDIGLADFYILANSVSKGVPVKAVFGLVQTNPWVITTYADAGIKAPQDLVGRSIAILADHKPLLEQFLRANNVDASQMTVRTVNVAIRSTLLAERRVDALVSQVLGSPMDFVARAEQGKGDPVSFLRFTDFGVASLGPGTFISNDFLTSRPETVRKFNRATARATADVARPENFDEAVDIALRLANASEERRHSVGLQWKETVQTLHSPATQGKPYGWMSDEDWKGTVKVLMETQNLSRAPELSALYTNDYLQ